MISNPVMLDQLADALIMTRRRWNFPAALTGHSPLVVFAVTVEPKLTV